MIKSLLIILSFSFAMSQTFQPMQEFITSTVCKSDQGCIASQPKPNPDVSMAATTKAWISFNPESTEGQLFSCPPEYYVG